MCTVLTQWFLPQGIALKIINGQVYVVCVCVFICICT